MNRTNVQSVDEYGPPTLAGWFDLDAAERFDEGRRWDGNNLVSLHTSDKFHHQTLYRTKAGRWVLNCSSRWQDQADTYEFVDDADARTWLLIAGHDDAVTEHLGEVEAERGPGRPAIGPAINVRFPAELLVRLGTYADAHGMARADVVRQAVESGLPLLPASE